MEKIFGIDLEKIFGGGNETTTLDKNTLQSVSQATVHTMKDDLAGDITKLSTSSTTPKTTEESTEKNILKTTTPAQINQKEISSPFAENKSPFPNLKQPQKEKKEDEQKNAFSPLSLSSSQVKPSIENQSISINKPNKITTTEKTNPQIIPSEKPINNSPGFNSGKALIFFFSFVLVVLLAGGGYYFWIKQQTPNPPTEISNSIIPTPAFSPLISPDPQKPLPKYLNVDFQNSTATQIIETIKKYLAESTFSPNGTPIEFVISDLQNNHISFVDFSSKIGLTIPAEIQTKLSEPFRFFASSYNENVGIGIITTSTDDATLKTILRSEEKNLITYFKPLLFTKPFGTLNTKNVTFNDNNYKNIDVRYYNILTQDELSFDYTVFENKFIFGTTMMTLRSIFNYLEEEKINQLNIGTALPPPTTPIPSPDNISLP